MRPLADEIRPQTLDDVAGQKHLLGEGALLRRLIENGTDANLIFYGPSGTGKTTVANIIAKQAKKALYTLNATTASLQDVKNVMADVDTMMAPNGILLYLDEIQYFNKKQQQSLLEFLENGKITLIASTTENPYFYIYTEDKVYIYEIFAYYETRSTSDRFATFTSDASYDDYVQWATEHSLYASDVDLSARGNIVSLSTCYGSAGTKKRALLHGVLTETVNN